MATAGEARPPAGEHVDERLAHRQLDPRVAERVLHGFDGHLQELLKARSQKPERDQLNAQSAAIRPANEAEATPHAHFECLETWHQRVNAMGSPIRSISAHTSLQPGSFAVVISTFAISTITDQPSTAETSRADAGTAPRRH